MQTQAATQSKGPSLEKSELYKTAENSRRKRIKRRAKKDRSSKEGDNRSESSSNGKEMQFRLDVLNLGVNSTFKAGFDFKLGNTYTLGPEIIYAGNDLVSLFGAAARLNWFVLGQDAIGSGMYLSPFAGLATLSVLGLSATLIYAGAYLGGQYVFPMGLSLGGGVGYSLFTASGATAGGISYEGNIGWAF